MFGCSYIYSDVVSVDVDTAPSLVYAARKYMLPALVRKCGDCLSEGLTVKNVIRVLETSFIIEDTDLESDCLHLIVEEPRAVLNGTEILAASPQTMEMIIQMDDLSLREIVIYETCIAWAKHQFQCNNSTDDQPTDQQIREILGDLLYLIRFPLMEGTEFLEISEGKNILIQKEKTSILHFLAAKKKGSQFKFSIEPRSASEEVCIERTVACLSALWTSSALVDVIDFTTSQDILLTGVGLYTGHNGADYEVDVEILQSTESLFKKKLTVPSTGDGNQFKVAVNEPIGLSIKAGVIYSVKALSSGDIGHYGRTCKAVCTEGNVTFSFLSNRLSPRTNPIFGQIPRLYFHF